MRELKFDRLFMKFLLSHLLVLLIPVLLIHVLFGYRFMRAYEREVQLQVDTDLTHLGNLIDAEMKTLTTTVSQMKLFVNPGEFHFDDNPLTARTFTNYLSIYTNTNPFVSEIALYLKNEDYLFTSTSTSRVDFFLTQLCLLEDRTPGEFKEMLLSGEHRQVLPCQTVHTPGKSVQYLIVLEPVYTDYQTVEGTCIFFIDSAALQKQFQAQLGSYDAVFVIRNSNGEILFESKQEADFLNDRESFVSEHPSDITGWTYAAYVPHNQQFMEKISNLNRELQYLTVSALVLAGLVISVFMRINYSPIRRLREKASSLSDENKALALKLKDSAAVIQCSRLHRLLTGHYISREDFNLDVSELDLEYKNDCFFVAVVQAHGKIKDYNTFAFAMQDRLSAYIESFYTFTPEPDKVILINGIQSGQAKQIKEKLEEMRNQIRGQYDFEVTIGVGNSYTGTLSIPKSYLEACSALDHRSVKGTGTVILYQDLLPADKDQIPYPKESLEYLVKSLKPSNRGSDVLLEEIQSYIQENCLRCDFSIQETADHFHMLLPNLSQFFKQKTAVNILDYSTDIRMLRAKQLLEEDLLTLKDISQQVGYYNASSFIRRFKQLYGITPGDYRKQALKKGGAPHLTAESLPKGR